MFSCLQCEVPSIVTPRQAMQSDKSRGIWFIIKFEDKVLFTISILTGNKYVLQVKGVHGCLYRYIIRP